ncbi:hypothetical protein QT397_03685 [Microbulbifer sp. MKSA007]|nr:hypothetical protein QT397_03685 [Microbulbifer sp. MKSA007]
MDKVQFEQVFGYSNDQAVVSYSSRGEISFAQFKRELAFVERKLKKSLNEAGIKKAAIFCKDSYEFSLLFLPLCLVVKSLLFRQITSDLPSKNWVSKPYYWAAGKTARHLV